MTLPRGWPRKNEQEETGEAEDVALMELRRPQLVKSQKKWFVLFFIFYVLVVIFPIILSPFYPNSLHSFLPSSIIAVIGIFVAVIFYSPIEDSKEDKRDLTNSIVVLSGIYAIVASLAITEALGAYTDALASSKVTIKSPIDLVVLLTSNPDYFKNTFLVLSFFSIASTSYLGATFFLSHKFEKRTLGKLGGNKGLFFSFILSFLQGIFLYFMSISIKNPVLPSEFFNRFVLWLFLLQTVDSIWIMIAFLSSSQGFKRRHTPPPPREWIPLNLLTMLFLLVYFLYPIKLTWDSYAELLGVLFMRTVADYRVGWSSVYSRVIKQT